MRQPFPIRKLRSATPAGYNLACFVPLEHDSADLSPIYAATPVLECASGVIGVLRAMEVRMGTGLLKELTLENTEYRLWHLEFLPEGGATIHDHRFKLHPRNDEVSKESS